MSYIMQDFAHRYQNDDLSQSVYYNEERQKLADNIIHYNGLRLRQSKVLSIIEGLQNSMKKISSEIWIGKK